MNVVGDIANEDRRVLVLVQREGWQMNTTEMGGVKARRRDRTTSSDQGGVWVTLGERVGRRAGLLIFEIGRYLIYCLRVVLEGLNI